MRKGLEATLANLEGYSNEQDLIEAQLAAEEELKKLYESVLPFAKNQMSAKAQTARLNKSENDFWYFDKIYFPIDLYDNYAPPAKFHKQLTDIADKHDKLAYVIHGPREHAKTLTLKKHFIWQMLFGKRKFMTVASENLKVPKAFLLDLFYILSYNTRLKNDFAVEFLEQSTEKMYIRCKTNPKGTFVETLSEGRSSKGLQRGFTRVDYIYVTDYESLISSLTKDAVQRRIEVMNEMRTSLSSDGVLIWEGNNFDPDCAMNLIKSEKEKGILSEFIKFFLFPAWDDVKKVSLWPERYPAKSEAELKQFCKPKDEYDWAGNYQGSPRKKSGDIFPNTFYQEYQSLPKDVQSVTWVDPNTSLKDKGDTTAIVNLGFSPSTQCLYITAARCRSYGVSNDLLRDTLILQREESAKNIFVITLGFDGNVAQEAIWTNNISNFIQINKMQFPNVKFKKYKVDALATNVEDKWKQNKIFFPPGFAETEEGKEFLKQFFGFRLKKANKTDDAPDAVISAYTLLVEEGLAYLLSGVDDKIFSVTKKRIQRI